MKICHFRKGVIFTLTMIFLSLILVNTIEQPVIEESNDIKELREEIAQTELEDETEIPEEIIEEAVEEVEEVVEEPKEEVPLVKTFISDAKCEDGIISLRLNNLYDDNINVDWSTFFISGKINPNPDCDMQELEPGESTFCGNVGGFPRIGRRRVAIAIYKHTTVGATVDCGSNNMITGSVIGELPYYGFNAVFFVLMTFLLLFTFNYYRVHY